MDPFNKKITKRQKFKLYWHQFKNVNPLLQYYNLDNDSINYPNEYRIEGVLNVKNSKGYLWNLKHDYNTGTVNLSYGNSLIYYYRFRTRPSQVSLRITGDDDEDDEEDVKERKKNRWLTPK